MMDRQPTTLLILLLSGLLTSPVFAQAETTPAPEEQTEASKDVPDSQEVEYNDDNYRRFMELRDQPGQRTALPTNTYQSGTQKLDSLPESSQKHLRNQLREIILDEGQWTPGDENKDYPYVASEAAEKSPTLQQQEAEAWGELLGKYHEREAQIYASNAGQQSGQHDDSQAQAQAHAHANTGGPGKQNTGESSEGEGSGGGEAGDGQGQKASQGQNAGQEQQTANSTNAASHANASSAAVNPNDPNSVSTSGVSQSALEYLMGLNSKASDGAPTTDSPTSGLPTPGSDAENLSQNQNPQKDSPRQDLQQQNSQQQNSQQQNSQVQNPARDASNPDDSQFIVISKNTLSIKDLQNAQGVSVSAGKAAVQNTTLNRDDEN